MYCAKVSQLLLRESCDCRQNPIRKARGRLVIVILTMKNSSVYRFSLPRNAKKTRTMEEKPQELAGIPIHKPSNNDAIPAPSRKNFRHDDDDDDDDDDDEADVDVITPPPPSTTNPYAKKPRTSTSKKPSQRLIVNNQTRSTFSVPNAVDGSSSINDIALFIRQSDSLFTDKSFVNRVRSMKYATTKNLSMTQRHIKRIFDCVKCHPKLKFLADSLPDPDAPDKIVPRLYLLVRGIPTPARMEVLNSVMCFFGESLYLLAYNGTDFAALSPEERSKVFTLIVSDYCFPGITK